jgi:hypothetical protein
MPEPAARLMPRPTLMLRNGKVSDAEHDLTSA